MNVTDVKNKAPKTQDMLKEIFEFQKHLHEKYVVIESAKGILTSKGEVDLNTCHGQQILKDYMWRVTEEIGEAANCLKSKPWKQSEILTDEVHYKEEIIDALHFFIELLILSGFTAESVYELYFKKQEVNKFRIRSKY